MADSNLMRMDAHHAAHRRIMPAPDMTSPDIASPHIASPKGDTGLRPDGTPADNDRVEIGPTPLAFAEWQAAGLTMPDLARLREHRLARLVAAINARGYGGVLLFDPLNIRYASDTSNMQLWCTHNLCRACFVGADGHMLVWDFKAEDLLTAHTPLVRETRAGAGFFYFLSGDKVREDASRFAGEVADVLRRHGEGSRKLGLDKIMPHGLRALEAAGITLTDGEEVMERARAVKGPEEIRAMRCAVHGCESALAEMQAAAAPGMCEAEIWSLLHAGNIKRGGEWIETRLMASGPRTNPWFQECGPRVVQDGDLLALDTDLVGCYGMCADISRTWLIGDREPTAEQRRLYREAAAQVRENTELLAPGVALRELTFTGRPLPDEFVEQRYSVRMHGVGLCDEWPSVYYPQDYREGAFDHCLEPGMVICVEAYIGAVGGAEGVKLENQVLITEDGHETLSHYPFESRLLD